jgi:hypothetical protein
MKRLYLKIVDSLKWMHSGIKKHAGYHIQSIPYSSIVHPKTTGHLCAYYTHNPGKLENHCREMACDGKTLYFCWTKPILQKDLNLDDKVSRR